MTAKLLPDGDVRLVDALLEERASVSAEGFSEGRRLGQQSRREARQQYEQDYRRRLAEAQRQTQ